MKILDFFYHFILFFKRFHRLIFYEASTGPIYIINMNANYTEIAEVQDVSTCIIVIHHLCRLHISTYVLPEALNVTLCHF